MKKSSLLKRKRVNSKNMKKYRTKKGGAPFHTKTFDFLTTGMPFDFSEIRGMRKISLKDEIKDTILSSIYQLIVAVKTRLYNDTYYGQINKNFLKRKEEDAGLPIPIYISKIQHESLGEQLLNFLTILNEYYIHLTSKFLKDKTKIRTVKKNFIKILQIYNFLYDLSVMNQQEFGIKNFSTQQKHEPIIDSDFKIIGDIQNNSEESKEALSYINYIDTNSCTPFYTTLQKINIHMNIYSEKHLIRHFIVSLTKEFDIETFSQISLPIKRLLLRVFILPLDKNDNLTDCKLLYNFKNSNVKLGINFPYPYTTIDSKIIDILSLIQTELNDIITNLKCHFRNKTIIKSKSMKVSQKHTQEQKEKTPTLSNENNEDDEDWSSDNENDNDNDNNKQTPTTQEIRIALKKIINQTSS